MVPAGQHAVSDEVAAWLVPALSSLEDDITTAITRELEEYARPGEDPAHARGIRRLARDAVAGFAARATQRGVPEPPEAALAASMFRDLGWLLAMEGVSLNALHAALRIGARVTWQRLQEQARQGSGNAEAFAQIGETVFWYMDELAASSSAGYLQATAEQTGQAGELRQRLLGMLIATPAPPAHVIASLAQAAGWPLPQRAAAVALAPLAESNPGPPPPGMLADLAHRDPCVLIADPDGPGRRRQLAAALHCWLTAGSHPGAQHPPPVQLAAVGPAVPLTEVSNSLRWARQALALARRGLIPAGHGTGGARITWCEDHLPTLVLLADTDLAATLSRETLAPLQRLRPDQADRLARTLLAWLESADDANAAASRLHVHPQTIRYRLRQASELFGDALADPDARFRLLLALRVRCLPGISS
jgi:hypothetical protein